MTVDTTSYQDFKKISRWNVRWMKGRVILLCLSIFLNVTSAYFLITKGLNFSIDFRGGVLMEVGFKNTPSIEALRTYVNDVDIADLPAIQVQSFGDKAFLLNLSGSQAGEFAETIVPALKTHLQKQYPDNIVVRRVETVGPKVGGELVETSVVAVVTAILAMLIYIWARFELPFAIGSVMALFHDVFITLGIFALFQIEFGLPIIAALLTIVGYSMNDTVVIYDRIRENLIKYRKALVADLIDLSVNETFARTLVTAGTLLISLGALYLFAGEVLESFVIAMIIGVFVGTYSSVFVAAPMLILWGVKNKFLAPSKKSKTPLPLL